jgi:hypothetical protein
MALDGQTRMTAAEGPAGDGGDVSDGRTGYYVAGHDWPAIATEIRIEDIYAALRGIEDADVAAAGKSLLSAGRELRRESGA